MNPYISTGVLAIVSQVGYHIAQKFVPPSASPLLVLACSGLWLVVSPGTSG